MTRGVLLAAALVVLAAYAHNALPHLTTLPRVNVDEPWLMERGFQVMRTGSSLQPMLGLPGPYYLQPGYGYLLAAWFKVFGVGLRQARLLGVALGLGILVCVAVVGAGLLGPDAGVAAAAFLAADSTFLGGVRNARTDIPSVFFIAASLACMTYAARLRRAWMFAASGACLGAAMLCHGNAFWAGVILLAWFVLEFGNASVTVPYGYAFLAGATATFGPYAAIVIARWTIVQQQIATFASPRVPGWRLSFLLTQILAEAERYRGWYFGLVTNLVPNPPLRVFQIASAIGVVLLALEAKRSSGARRVLVLAVGAAAIFAAFINNKVPVYLPHLLIGFSLAAGYAVVRAARVLRVPALALIGVMLYSAAGVAYYERWYRSALTSELVPYERTEATLRTLVPPGPSVVVASPHFWTPFHDDSGVTFLSYSSGAPEARSDGRAAFDLVTGDRPLWLAVDEYQWMPDAESVQRALPPGASRGWIWFIGEHCVLAGEALGTAYGTIALYRCQMDGRPDAAPLRIVGDAVEYVPGDSALRQTSAELSLWPKYEDARRSSSSRPSVRLDDDGLRVSGTGWPGIQYPFPAARGERYLVRSDVARARPGDLLYLGMWQHPQVLSLSGASSSGIAVPLMLPAWFPHDRAFVATGSPVRVVMYSEAPETDFLVRNFSIHRLRASTH
jgi:4-amino-4-deoxy-L-arabinose transferase-like glycosyltransferase